jgi:hypothetical protein
MLVDDFEEIKKEQSVNLQTLLDQVYSSAQKSLQDLHDKLIAKHQDSLIEKENYVTERLKVEQQKVKELENQFQIGQDSLEKKNKYITDIQENISSYFYGVRRKKDNEIMLMKIFNAWHRLTIKAKAIIKYNALATKVSHNFVKGRVFSRFAYNLVSRNFESEKKNYLQNYNEQSSQVFQLYIYIFVIFMFK